MTNRRNLVAALESAIKAHTADVPGTWAVDTGDEYVQLVWTCPAGLAASGEWYGDEPWAQWGGNLIIEAAGAPLVLDDSGWDSYTDKHGDEVVCQWVQWGHRRERPMSKLTPKVLRIENWRLIDQQETNELPLLSGNIYGDYRYPDGTLIHTEKIISRRDYVALDIDGRLIELGKPTPTFKEQ